MSDPHKAVDFIIANSRRYAQAKGESIVLLEAWKPVVGFDLYRVSNLGNIERLVCTKNQKKYRKVCPWNTANGYKAVGLSKKSVVTTKLVHRIVAESWIGDPDGMDVCHNNGNRSDNRLSNLRIDTRKGNMADIYIHNTHIRGERCGTNKYSEDFIKLLKRRIREGGSIRSIAIDLGIPPATAYNIHYKQTWGWLE